MIYYDVTEIYRSRTHTGIQRVLREVLSRAINDKAAKNEVRAIAFDAKKGVFVEFGHKDTLKLLEDPKTANPKIVKKIRIDQIGRGDTFFDMDSVWNIPLKRTYLYGQLKHNKAQIVTYVYDLAPIKFPQFTNDNTLRNFASYLTASYEFSDLVMFDSRSSERDYLELGASIGVKRHIPTLVTKLGSDFAPSKSTSSKESSEYADVINSKYILFVGTLEPRKNQELLVDSFTEIAKKHSSVNLVLVGKEGWLVEGLIKKINKHPLKDVRLFWFSSVDDYSLSQFYKNAYLSVYLSKHEGFGLPISESLDQGLVTVTSKNSSMYEVGKDFADYLIYNTKTELKDILELYLTNKDFYNNKKKFIQQNYNPYTWDAVYELVKNVFSNNVKTNSIKKQKLQNRLQHVMISIDDKNVKECIARTDKFSSMVKEYLIVTSPTKIKSMRRIKSSNKITIVDEESLLGEDLELFKKAAHQQKNWLLRSKLTVSDKVNDVFIMLDDDNMPITEVDISHYIAEDGSYKAYYYNEINEWPHYDSDYDLGQQTTSVALDDMCLELLSYSSHCPQVIDKKLFAESLAVFAEAGRSAGIDEWSSYFNYVATKYPMLLQKKPYATLNWPGQPSDWVGSVAPDGFVYENYYQDIYQNGLFSKLQKMDTDSKLDIKHRQQHPFDVSRISNKRIESSISKEELVHGVLRFFDDSSEVYMMGVPYIVTNILGTVHRLNINCKVLDSRDSTYEVIVRSGTSAKTSTAIPFRYIHKEEVFMDARLSLPVLSRDKTGVANSQIEVFKNGKLMQTDGIYMIKNVTMELGQEASDYIRLT